MHVDLRGTRHRLCEVENDPTLLGFQDIPGTGSVVALWDEAIAPSRTQLATQGDNAWPVIVRDYDNFSTRESLQRSGWSEGAIECFGRLGNLDALMNSSFLEVLREELTDSCRDPVQIRGWMDQVPAAFAPQISSHVRFGARMVAIRQDESSVTVRHRTPGRGNVRIGC